LIVNKNQFPDAARQANAAKTFQPNLGWLHQPAHDAQLSRRQALIHIETLTPQVNISIMKSRQ
jgi:hypothetical protein